MWGGFCVVWEEGGPRHRCGRWSGVWEEAWGKMQNGAAVQLGGILTRLGPPGAQTPFCIIIKGLGQSVDYNAERCSNTFGGDSDSSGPTWGPDTVLHYNQGLAPKL